MSGANSSMRQMRLESLQAATDMLNQTKGSPAFQYAPQFGYISITSGAGPSPARLSTNVLLTEGASISLNLRRYANLFPLRDEVLAASLCVEKLRKEHRHSFA
jgi:hypothetical protein